MRHRKVARQPRAAVTGPGVKACVAAAPHTQHHSTEAPDPRRAGQSESSPARTEIAATEAEILVGTTMWLDRVRDWLAEVLDQAPVAGAQLGTITLRRSDLEAFRGGLAQAIGLLDQITGDPTQLPPLAEPPAAPDVALITTTAAGRLH